MAHSERSQKRKLDDASIFDIPPGTKQQKTSHRHLHGLGHAHQTQSPPTSIRRPDHHPQPRPSPLTISSQASSSPTRSLHQPLHSSPTPKALSHRIIEHHAPTTPPKLASPILGSSPRLNTAINALHTLRHGDHNHPAGTFPIQHALESTRSNPSAFQQTLDRIDGLPSHSRLRNPFVSTHSPPPNLRARSSVNTNPAAAEDVAMTDSPSEHHRTSTPTATSSYFDSTGGSGGGGGGGAVMRGGGGGGGGVLQVTLDRDMLARARRVTVMYDFDPRPADGGM